LISVSEASLLSLVMTILWTFSILSRKPYIADGSHNNTPILETKASHTVSLMNTTRFYRRFIGWSFHLRR